MYKEKYLKYKTKYMLLTKQLGGDLKENNIQINVEDQSGNIVHQTMHNVINYDKNDENKVCQKVETD